MKKAALKIIGFSLSLTGIALALYAVLLLSQGKIGMAMVKAGEGLLLCLAPFVNYAYLWRTKGQPLLENLQEKQTYTLPPVFVPLIFIALGLLLAGYLFPFISS